MKPPARAAALLLLAVHTAGCTTWRVTPEPPAAVLAELDGPSVRVTTVDGRREVVVNPVIDGDSIEGTPQRQTPENRRYAAALADVRLLELRQRNRAASAVVLGVAALGIVALVVGAALEDWTIF